MMTLKSHDLSIAGKFGGIESLLGNASFDPWYCAYDTRYPTPMLNGRVS